MRHFSTRFIYFILIVRKWFYIVCGYYTNQWLEKVRGNLTNFAQVKVGLTGWQFEESILTISVLV